MVLSLIFLSFYPVLVRATAAAGRFEDGHQDQRAGDQGQDHDGAQRVDLVPQ